MSGTSSRPLGAAARSLARGPSPRLLTAWLLAAGVLAAAGPPASAEDIYLPPADFVALAFDGAPPAGKNLWLRGGIQDDITSILGHRYGGLRIKYWREGSRTAWILEEIGKYEPITAGFIVDDAQLADVRILIYRESHGWEVRYPFFTDQFRGLELNENRRLTGPIDGISGATLSVSSITRLAALALFLDARVAADAGG